MRFLKKRAFLLLVLVFLGLRLTILLTAVESVCWTSWGEELYRGTIAKELMEGLKAPLWDYQADPYDGGSLFVGIMAVPFFALLGPNLLALKLVPLGLSLATLILSFLLFRRFFDRKTAFFVCLLLTLSPPVFTSLCLVAIGSHPDAIFFSVAILFSFYRFLYGEKGKEISLILFGLVSGFGFWFCPITFITTLTCLVSWLLLDRRSLFSRQAFIFLGSFGVGALPFLLSNIRHHFRFLGFLEYAFLWNQELWGNISLAEKLLSIPIRILTLLLRTFPLLFYFRPFWILHPPLTLLYGLVTWFLILPFFWKEIRRSIPLLRDHLRRGRGTPHSLENLRSIPFLVFPVVFVLIYSVSNYPPIPPPYESESFTSFRYFSPLYFFLFSLLAMALRSSKRLALHGSILLSLGFIGQCSLVFHEPVGRALSYSGYSYAQMGDAFGNAISRFPGRFDEFQRLANRFSDPKRRGLYWGWSYVLATIPTGADPHIDRMAEDSQRALETIRRIPSEYRMYFLENWGRYVGRLTEKELARGVTLGRLLSEEEQPYFYYGLATKIVPGLHHSIVETNLSPTEVLVNLHRPFYYLNLGMVLYRKHQQDPSKMAMVDIPGLLGREEKIWLYRGMGMEASRNWIPSMSFSRLFDSLMSEIPLKDQAELLWGVGWGIGWGAWFQHSDDRARILDWIDRLPEGMRRSALQGFQAFERWYRIPPET